MHIALPGDDKSRKRKAEDYPEDEIGQAAGYGNAGDVATQASPMDNEMGALVGPGQGGSLITPGQDHMYLNACKMTFAKTFQFFLRNANYKEFKHGADENALSQFQFPYYNIMWSKLMWYMSPGEWWDTIGHHRYGKMDKAKFQIRYLSHIPFYKTGSTETQIASPNNVARIHIFRDMEQIIPFKNGHTESADANPDLEECAETDFAKFQRRLYGGMKLDYDQEIGAIDGPRRYPFRPYIVNNAGSSNYPEEFNPRKYVTGYNILGHKRHEIPTNMIDATYGFSHKIKNGIFDFGISASTVQDNTESTTKRWFQVNNKRIQKFNIEGNDKFKVSYHKCDSSEDQNYMIMGLNNDSLTERAYQIADIENYTLNTTRNDAPIHHCSSMWIGVAPQLDIDSSLIDGQTFLEIQTELDIDFQRGHAITHGWDLATAAYKFDQFSKVRSFQTNDTDVLMADYKGWNGSYTIGGKPCYYYQTQITPQMANKKKTVIFKKQ